MYNEKTIESVDVFSGVAVKLKVDKVELPNGEVANREIVETKASVSVIALTKSNKVLLVKQFRKPVERHLIEIPAGYIEESESPLEAAKRELLEETGYGNGVYRLINKYVQAAGTNRSEQYIFFAADVEKISETLDTDDDEFLEVREYSIREFDELVDSGEIVDMKTAFAHLIIKSML